MTASITPCATQSHDCPRERRWSAKRGGWLWLCECGRAFPEDVPGVPGATPLRGEPNPSIRCPLCQSPKGMVLVQGGRNGPFHSCDRYPKCKGTRPIQSQETKK